MEVAELFMAREGMAKGFLEQITTFLRKNTKGVAEKKTLEKNLAKEEKSFKYIPMNSCIFFENMNMEGLYKKTLEFNDKVKEEVFDLALTEKEIIFFKSLTTTLGYFYF